MNCDLIMLFFCIKEKPNLIFRVASRITIGLVGLFSRILVGKTPGKFFCVSPLFCLSYKVL